MLKILQKKATYQSLFLFDIFQPAWMICDQIPAWSLAALPQVASSLHGFL
jgi:hypothetical protein